jgi:DNA-binding CsgD family transcriptional regulator
VPKRSRDSVLSMVEAAYAVECSTQEWTAGILQAADGAIGAGLSGFACTFRKTKEDTLAIDRSTASSLKHPEAELSAIFNGISHAPPGWLSAYLTRPQSISQCLLTSEVDPKFKLSYRARLAEGGVHDGINVASMDLDGSGLLLSIGVPGPAQMTRSMRESLSRVATHFLAALRLRARLAAASSPPSGNGDPAPGPTDALLSPDGKLLHAEGEAKLADAQHALQAAVRNVEHARQSLRDDPAQALGMWKGLVSARWTLLDQFDRGGTKYIVARENAPRTPGLPVLTPTERCIVRYASRGLTTKEIAYTLGISDTTVRVLFMRAARRCGVSTRAALIKLSRNTFED